jgi:hypothetical protein
MNEANEAIQRVVDAGFYLRFDRAKRYLLAAGFTIDTAKRAQGIYFVNVGDGEFMCSRHDVIFLALQKGMPDDRATGVDHGTT